VFGETVSAVVGVGVQGKSDPNAELLDAALLVGHLVPPGSVYAFLAEHRKRLFPDERFGDLFPSGTGRPSVPADVLATVLVLQSLEGLSDREAVERLRCDIRWKVACGLALDDEGFHPTTLTYWRNRLRASDAPQRVFDAVRQVITETGLLRGRLRRALDSTVLDDAVATQDTVTQLVAQIRRVRRQIPAAAAVEVTAHDYEQAGRPPCDWDDEQSRQRLVSDLVNDALAILDALDEVELDETGQQTVGLLALVAGQDVEEGDEPGTWRIVRGTVKDRVISTVDPDSRHVHKTVRSYRDGFKGHVAVEPETGLITATTLTAGNVYDGETVTTLLALETEPVEVLADCAYGSGETRAQLTAAGHRQTIKPAPLRPPVPGGFTSDDFTIDLAARTATCPGAHTVPINRSGKARFGSRCDGCPLRSHCTHSKKGRDLKIHPHHHELARARRDAKDPGWQGRYRRWRPMVERTIAWLVADGHRRVGYRGIERNGIWFAHRAAAVNLKRLIRLGLNHNGTGWAVTHAP
jgi:IS5 family transposase